MYDVIVVGARVAGSPLAMLLARAGRRVLVVERSAFPSDVNSTHNLIAPGCALMERWGLLDRLAATGCPPAANMRVHVPGAVLELPPCSAADGVTYAPRRHVLDPLLAAAAAEAGAEVRNGVHLVDLVWEQGRVAGAVLRQADGAEVVERATVVVGADGSHSTTARLVGATNERERRVNNAGVYAYWTWPGTDVEVLLDPTGLPGEIIVFPTHGGEACIVYACRLEHWFALRAAVEDSVITALAARPALADWLQTAERRSRFRLCGNLDGYVRPASGSGWALIGDAGMHKDPTPGRGMSDAFVQAQLLADHLAPALDDTVSADLALERFSRARDDWFLDLYDATNDMVQYDWDPAASESGRTRLAELAVLEMARLRDLSPGAVPA